MKNKFFTIIVIIIISFILGICINHFISLKNQEKDNSLFVIGTIINIIDNTAILEPQDENLKTTYPQMQFSLPEGNETSWVIGDIVKVKYLPEHISETGFIEITSLESYGKARLFDPENDVPVSNAEHRGNKIIFKSFFSYDDSINLDDFSTSDELYYKKIISYSEYQKYKELIPELRTLTENDFINYYLIIAMSKDIEHIYMFNRLDETENSISLEILKNKTLSNTSQTPTFSGVAIILPNVTEVPTENIKLTIEN